MKPDLRDSRRQVVAALVRKFGFTQLEVILDATQDALVAALVSWPHHGEPTDPTRWLVRTAERKVIDQLRRSQRLTVIPENLPSADDVPDELTLYFMTGSPRLNIREQVCLMLRALAGLTAGEIGRLLHESEEAVQRRISRAKDKLTLEDLNAGDKESKHDSVSLALYLMFTEGYEASRGNEYVRLDLALCALRLAEELAKFSTDTSGKLEALLALMHFNLSRMAARVDSNGEPILLPDQDRSRYDMGHVSRGFFYLSEAQKGTDLSRYHMEAGLAAAICASADSGEVLYWHRTLATHFPTPVNRISLAIALGEYEDYSVGLSALDRLAEDDLVTRTPHFHCARGHFLAKLGRREEAGDAFRRAIAAGMSNPARRSFEARIEELG